MKHSRLIVVVLAIFVSGLLCLELLAQVPDPIIGTWELNLAKSKFASGPPPKTSTRTFVQDGVQLKFTNRGIDADGKSYLVQFTARYDGKDYPLLGSTNSDTIMLKRIDRFTTESIQKKGGKVVWTNKRVVSADGKTLTLTAQGKDAQGKPATNVLVFDKK